MTIFNVSDDTLFSSGQSIFISGRVCVRTVTRSSKLVLDMNSVTETHRRGWGSLQVIRIRKHVPTVPGDPIDSNNRANLCSLISHYYQAQRCVVKGRG